MEEEVGSTEFFRPWNSEDTEDPNNNNKEIIEEIKKDKCEVLMDIEENADENVVSSTSNELNLISKNGQYNNTSNKIVDDKNILNKIVDDKNILNKIVDDKNILNKIVDDKNILNKIDDVKNTSRKIVDDKNILNVIVDDKNTSIEIIVDDDKIASETGVDNNNSSEEDNRECDIITQSAFSYYSPRKLPEAGSLEKLSQFVFNSSPETLGLSSSSSTSSPIMNVSSSSSSWDCNDSPKSAFTQPIHSPDQSPNTYSGYNYSPPLENSDNSVNSKPSTSFNHPFTHHLYPNYQPQPFYYIMPEYIPISPFMNHRVEEAVNLVNQQDEAAKRLKKLRPKKFPCTICNHAFSNNGQLRGHMRSHTGDRPFKCDKEGCGKAFTRNEELTRHKRIHTGLKPHSCVLCGKKFGRKDHLKKHLKTHENRAVMDVMQPPPGLGSFALNHHILPQRYPMPTYIYPRVNDHFNFMGRIEASCSQETSSSPDTANYTQY